MSTTMSDISTTTTKTGCYAAELIWEAPQAARFRQLMVMAVGRDCVCEEGGPCWLMDAALKGVVTKDTLKAEILAGYATLDDDRKQLLADEAARLIEDQRAATS